MNDRFMWIKTPSKYVRARLSHPKDGLSICWIEVKSKAQNFDFITRRALPYKSCLAHVGGIRKLIAESKTLEIIGNSAEKDGKNSYSSIWEVIRSPEKCIGYFGDCEEFEKRHPEWQDWKEKGIDSKIYP